MIDFQSIPTRYRHSDINASGIPITYTSKLQGMPDTPAPKKREPAPRSEFGARLVDARNAARLTQHELCKKAGISQSTLAEAEKTGKGSTFTVRLAQALGVEPLWLESGEGPRAAAASGKPMPMDDLRAHEVLLIAAIRDGLSKDEAVELTNAVKLAVKTKHLRVSNNEEVGTLGVYFAVDRRKRDESVPAERRELAPWEKKGPKSGPMPQESSK